MDGKPDAKTESKQDARGEQAKRTLKIELPDGTVQAEGSAAFITVVRAALVPVLLGQASPIHTPSQTGALGSPTVTPPTATATPLPRVPSIRDLYAEKRPGSDSQAAALIAYYLSELAPAAERTETVDTETVIRYFKLCQRQLPSSHGSILSNAKRDGFLDSAGERGKYKLSPIGYNLVVHALPASPRGSEVSKSTVRRGRRGKGGGARRGRGTAAVRRPGRSKG